MVIRVLPRSTSQKIGYFRAALACLVPRRHTFNYSYSKLMKGLRKIHGNWYGYFYDKTKRPKQKSVPLSADNEEDAEITFAVIKTEYDKGAFDPWTEDFDDHDPLPYYEEKTSPCDGCAEMRQRILDQLTSINARLKTIENYYTQSAWTVEQVAEAMDLRFLDVWKLVQERLLHPIRYIAPTQFTPEEILRAKREGVFERPESD